MRKLATIMTLVYSMTMAAQTFCSLADSLEYRVEMQSTLSDGEHTPLWLNANRYGLSSLRLSNGYLRGALSRPLERDSARRWGVGYAADVVIPAAFTSHFVVQQAYVEGRWLKGVLTLGSKEYPMELKNQELSSGSQTFGINARPIPQLRIALPDYWTVPYTRGWIAIKGHLSYGMPTDGSWQKEFTKRETKYVEHGLYHSKAGYMRIGKKHVSLELGLEMACQFGGTSYLFNEELVLKNKSDLGAFFHALIPGGSDTGEAGITGVYENADGNHVGSWLARLNIDRPKWGLALYADHYFEDHSGMFFLDYDGYGSGQYWNKKEKFRFFMYDLKDMLLGAELTLKRVPWLHNIVLEYLCTKYQSGPVYHDHSKNINTHIAGRDDYYNHSKQTGWQHWGMVMGNPLYLSPLYNDDGTIMVKNNRFVAWHLGLSGNPVPQLHYRLLATWQRGFGTYKKIYPDPRENVSLLAEAQYTLPRGGWLLKAAFGMDRGKIYGDNYGVQLTVAKTGLLRVKKEKDK